MGCRILIVSSVTYAIKGKALLSENGIRSKIHKVSRAPEDGGCAYGIRISRDDLYGALDILNTAGIVISGNIDCEAYGR